MMTMQTQWWWWPLSLILVTILVIYLIKRGSIQMDFATLTLFRDREAGVEGWISDQKEIWLSWELGTLDKGAPKWAGRLPNNFKTRVFVIDIDPTPYWYRSYVLWRLDDEEIEKHFSVAPPFPVLPPDEKEVQMSELPGKLPT